MMEDGVELLIEEVRKRPEIFDRSCNDYANINIKNRKWEEVCAKVIPNWSSLEGKAKRIAGMEVRKKWMGLRSCLARELRLQKGTKSCPASKRRRKYIYYNQLSFLLPTIKNKSTSGNLDDEESTSDNDSYSETTGATQPEQKSSALHKSVTQPHPEQSSPVLLKSEPEQNSSILLKSEPEQNSSMLLKPLTQPEQNSSILLKLEPEQNSSMLLKSVTQPEQNSSVLLNSSTQKYSFEESLLKILETKIVVDTHEDTHFCLSLVPILQSLDDYHKMEAKIQIMNLLKNLKWPGLGDSHVLNPHD